MKKLENQTVFQCSYCSKISKSAAGIYSHEKYCKKNPHNQLLCASCIHCEMVESLDDEGSRCNYCSYNYMGDCHNPDCSDDRQRIVDFVCKIDNAKMYAPNKIRRKASFRDIVARCDRPMIDATQNCEHYKFQFDND